MGQKNSNSSKALRTIQNIAPIVTANTAYGFLENTSMNGDALLLVEDKLH